MNSEEEERPVLKTVRSLDGSKLLARFYDYAYFEEVMRATTPALPAICGQMVRTGTGSTTCTREFGHMGLCDWKVKP